MYVTTIGADLAGLLGGRMASAEGGSVPSGVEYGEGCPLSSRLKGLGERRELPQRGPGRPPAENGLWRILKATERLFLYLYDKIWGGEQFALVSPRSKFWGDLSSLSPCDLRPCVRSRCGTLADATTNKTRSSCCLSFAKLKPTMCFKSM